MAGLLKADIVPTEVSIVLETQTPARRLMITPVNKV